MDPLQNAVDTARDLAKAIALQNAVDTAVETHAYASWMIQKVFELEQVDLEIEAGEHESTCYRREYDRGVGKIRLGCSGRKSDEDAGLCYKPCKDGYDGVGPVCWKKCRSGYTNHGATCYKNVLSWYFKSTYGRGAGVVPTLQCRADEEEEGGLCYKQCRPGYDGHLTMCWMRCSASGFTECGLMCSLNTGSCITDTMDLIMSVGEVAIFAGSFVSGGVISAAVTMYGGISPAMGAAGTFSGFLVDDIGAIADLFGESRSPSELDDRRVRVAAKMVAEAGGDEAAATAHFHQMRDTSAALQTISEAAPDSTLHPLHEEIDQNLAESSVGVGLDLIGVPNIFSGDYDCLVANPFDPEAMSALVAGSCSTGELFDQILDLVSVVDFTGITGVISTYMKPTCDDPGDLPTTCAATGVAPNFACPLGSVCAPTEARPWRCIMPKVSCPKLKCAACNDGQDHLFDTDGCQTCTCGN